MFIFPIEKEVAKKALKALKRDEDYPYRKNYGKSNGIVNKFAEQYLREKEGRNRGSSGEGKILESLA